MSDNEMRNLILQAATLLEVHRDREINRPYSEKPVIAAMAYGAAVLRMVAACMVTETEALPKTTPARGEGGRFIKGGA